MHNPLASLCGQLSLDEAALARILGCSTAAVRQALAEEPREPLRTYLELGAALGVKMRLVVDQPLGLWFELGAIDALHQSSQFRRSCGLDPLPANRGELRQLIRKLRRRGLSYAQIADRLQKSFIPTATGVRTWRRSTIGQHVTIKVSGEDGELPLGMSDEFRLAFRAHAIRCLLVAMCPFDPFASVRYEMQQSEKDGRLLLETKTPLPASIRRWIAAAVADLEWFRPTQWGEIQHDEIQGQPLQGTEAGRSAQPPSSADAAQTPQGTRSPAALDEHQPAHGLDDLPRSDGRRAEADPASPREH